MSDLDSLVAQSKDAISALINKPKMAEKLLSKPPFRFLHDIVSAITTTTGFAEGLFEGPELDSAGITDKTAKVEYLDKIFTYVGICTGAAIDVRALKVVAGLEPENTNIFLIALAQAASDPDIDVAEALRRFQAGERPGDNPPPRKSGGSVGSRAESKESSHRDDAPKAGAKSAAPAPAPAPAPYEAKMAEIEAAPERGKSRGGTRGGKPQSQSNDVGLAMAASSPSLDGELERCDGSFAVTQTLLSELISKPKLSDKLLSKPPFRFLYDIIMEVSRVTGFAAGLFTPEEWDSAQVASKEQKMLYLEKIVRVVGVQLNTLVEAKPTKIVAGLDPDMTNRFLQCLAVAAKHLPDSREAVRAVLEQLGLPLNDMGGTPTPSVSSSSPSKASTVQATSAMAEEKQAARPALTSAPAPAAAKAEAAEDKGGDDEDKKGGFGRPTTARRRPPKVAEGAKEVDKKEAVVAKKAEGIMADGAGDDDDEIPDETRLADDVQSDAKSGTGGGPQSKLVQDILGRQAEQEAARLGASGQASSAASADEETKGEETGKGGIRLGRLRKSGTAGEGKKGAASTAVFADGDFERLRAAIQSLVQHTGPLGSCLDFLQEDVGLMTSELRRWEDEARKFDVRVETERQRSEEKLHPLQSELVALDEQIAEQIGKISSTKANIARNEDRIVQLLKLMSSS